MREMPQRIRKLNFAAGTRFDARNGFEYIGRQNITTDNREIRWRVLRLRFLDHGVDATKEITRLATAAGGRQALLIRSNADIRAMSLDIFDRTFIITRVLYWLAAGIAAIGLVSALLAWELDRARELSVLRALGLTPRGAAALVTAQTVFMGSAALLAAIPAGLIIAVVLTKVIDRRAFGWNIEMHLHAAQFLNALALALAAALIAGLYPAWRTSRAPIAAEMREE